MTFQSLREHQPDAIALEESDDRFDRELAGWFAQHGGVWSGTAAELRAAVKNRVGAANDSWTQSPSDIYAHVESHQQILKSLGVDALVHQQYPRMISLSLCQNKRHGRIPQSNNFGNQ